VSQRGIYTYITPSELLSILKESCDADVNVFVLNWSKYEVLRMGIQGLTESDLQNELALGYGELGRNDTVGQFEPWNCGYILVGSPWLDTQTYKRAQIVYQTKLTETTDYERSKRTFSRIYAHIKKISTRGVYLRNVLNQKPEKDIWLSEGAHTWLKDGHQLTVYRTERITHGLL